MRSKALGVEHAERRRQRRCVDGHDVGGGEQLVERHQSRRPGTGDSSTAGSLAITRMPSALATTATREAMRPMPTRPSTLPSSSRARPTGSPLQALAGTVDVMREVLGHGEHQRQRVLGGRHHRRDRRVAHDDPCRGGVGDVDVVVADTDARDDLGVRRQRERRRVPRPHRAGEDRVGGVEAVVGAGSDDDRPPVDEVVGRRRGTDGRRTDRGSCGGRQRSQSRAAR